MLIEYGNTTVDNDWKLNEASPTGFCRVYYITNGEIQFECDGESHTLKSGLLYILPSSRPYRASIGEVPPSFLYMHMSFDKNKVDGLIEINPHNDECLLHLLKTMHLAVIKRRHELLELLSDALTPFLRVSPKFTIASRLQSSVQKYVIKHIKEDISIDTLAERFSYHPNYFIRLFHQETGYTPYSYILQLKMQYAVSLLNKGMSNKQVSDACGYQDSCTFTRAFSKYYGVSPQKYVKGIRKT